MFTHPSLPPGIPGLLKADMVKEGAAVIDIGKLLQLVGLPSSQVIGAWQASLESHHSISYLPGMW
jgi:5,10-methylene-tetrahydrofolate dehydrogenase/methenyl tetrahydrofolate cyclohydrolase